MSGGGGYEIWRAGACGALAGVCALQVIQVLLSCVRMEAHPMSTLYFGIHAIIVCRKRTLVCLPCMSVYMQ
jgi:hypothetical protein